MSCKPSPSTRSRSRTITLTQKVDVEVTPANFELLQTAYHLDLEQLAQLPHARLEIGTVETECCRRTVVATVQKGMITDLEFDGDEPARRQPATPELEKLLESTLEAFEMKTAARNRLPVSLGDLVLNPGLSFEWWTCFRFCILGICITCCYGKGPDGKPFTVCG